MIELKPLNTAAYQRVLISYQTFRLNPELDESRRAFFTSLAELIPTLGLRTPEALQKGVHYREALLIKGGKSSIQFPEALRLLHPLAENYCMSFGNLLRSLENPPKRPEALKSELDKLCDVHFEFRLIFNTEYNKL